MNTELGEINRSLVANDLHIKQQSPYTKQIPSKTKGIRLEEDETQESQNQDGIYITLKVGEQRNITFNMVELNTEEPILILKKKFFQPELDQNLIVRFISMGRMLGDNQIINSIKWTNGQVVLVHISEPLPQQHDQPIEPQPQQDQQNIAVLNEQELNDLQNQLNLVLNQRHVANHLVQAQIPPPENEGTYLDVMVGIFVGFVFTPLAVLLLCFCPCPLRAKQGVILGFVIRMMYVQLILMQGDTNTKSTT